ncbi:c-type cytochrome domain-containing protein [Hydrocarboniphaga sp.]|uniref:c-type cytochrome domain-containing protein n=1 Tax=Hydrocarboniphaga sp. TaxID=2033016 RepID=UPI00260D482A|nr:c-type cytochrome domain-containing protein [Hydrocarboniphaga sp.]
MCRLLLSSLCLALGACAGNGDDLDQNGRPISEGGTPDGELTASFQSIQDNVFTPICTQCHAGASAPQGLDLQQGSSYDMIVNVVSQEQPTLARIAPGDPDASYLIQKIAGAAGISGARMPYGCPTSQPCLDAATIDVIRQWVSNGALND